MTHATSLSIGVVMTTCAREGRVGDLRASYAEQTIASLANLHYDGPMRLHFADDGSRDGYREHLLQWGRRHPQDWNNVTVTNAHGQGIGKGLNLALEFLDCDLIFHLPDDYELIGDLDLTIPAALLEDESLGMVRTGMVHPGLQARSEYGGPELQYYWVIDKARSGFAFGLRTWLAHRRFFQAYGEFPEGVDLYNTERIYNERVRETDGPGIAYAGNVQLNHPWRHIGETACSEGGS